MSRYIHDPFARYADLRVRYEAEIRQLRQSGCSACSGELNAVSRKYLKIAEARDKKQKNP